MRYWIIALLITSCNGANNSRKIVAQTNELNKVQEKAPISFVKAKEIFQKYHNKNEFAKLSTMFYYYDKGYYFFGYHTDPMKDKQKNIWYFLEAKISGETGNIIKLNEPIEWKKNRY